MKRDISPEEKLLKVIRTKKEEPQDKDEIFEKKDPYFGKFEKIDGRVGAKEIYLSNTEKKWITKIGELKYLNLILAVFLIVLGGYLIFEIFSQKPSEQLFEELKGMGIALEVASKDHTEAVPSEKPLSYYSKELGGKELFKSGLETGEEDLKPKGPTEEKIASEILSNLSLLGIVKGDNPQAIIEDKRSQKTYFLSKGQMLGEIKIIDIFENKIIIELKGKEYELVL